MMISYVLLIWTYFVEPKMSNPLSYLRYLSPVFLQTTFPNTMSTTQKRPVRYMSMTFNRLAVHDLLNNDSSHYHQAPTPMETSMPPRKMHVYREAQCDREMTTSENVTSQKRQDCSSARRAYVCKHCCSNFSSSPNLKKHVSI